jgi:hypothetical protein
MKKYLAAILFLLMGMILSADHVRTYNIVRSSIQEPSPISQANDPTAVATPAPNLAEVNQIPTIQPTPTPDPFPNLYSCTMKLSFTSGPLAGNSTDFSVLGEEYFAEKGDSFFPGKNTAVYYDPPRYLILHSAFENGNMLKPLEAEFIRFYLEYWGDSGNAFVQGNIDSLIGSTVIWSCDDEIIFSSSIRDIVRLSQIASNQLWLDPQNLELILTKKEGLVSEWIGAMDVTSEPTVYIGFCGWGPIDSGDLRFAYYRYLINFDIDFSPALSEAPIR